MFLEYNISACLFVHKFHTKLLYDIVASSFAKVGKMAPYFRNVLRIFCVEWYRGIKLFDCSNKKASNILERVYFQINQLDSLRM